MTYFNKIKTVAFIFVLLMLYSGSINAQWATPDDSKIDKAPTDASYTLVNQGKIIYKANCSSCHGIPGKGNNIAAINATDFGTKDFQKNHSDAQIYWKTDTGKGGMPPFKDKLSTEEMWNLCFYIKSFDKNYEISGEKIIAVEADIKVSVNEKDKRIKAEISADGAPTEGAVVQFYVKKMFGNMLLKTVESDANGIASITLQKEIPGNEEGNFDILVNFKNTDAFGKKEITKTLNFGTKLHFEKMTDKRAMWGTNSKTPLWTLFSYLGITLGVWAVIIYVVFKLIGLKKAGRS